MIRAHHGHVRFIAWCLIGLLALCSVAATPVLAQNAAPAFVLAPTGESGPYFDETLKPGETKTLKVGLGNAGEAPVTARTYAANAFTLVNGGFGVRGEDDPAAGPTLWLSYKAETLDLQPGKLIERSFAVAVPKNAKPGQYIAGLVVQTAESVPVNGSPMLRQTILKSIAVFITVPGAVRPALAIGAVSVNPNPGARVVSVEIENAGNVLLKPAGSVTIKDASGALVSTAPIAMGSVYAGMTTTIELTIDASVAPGAYHVAVDLHDEATGAKASAADLPVTLPDLNAATPAPNPVTIGSIAIDPVRDAAGAVKYVNVDVKIANSGDPIASARLTLHVTRDSAPVEDFPLSSSLAVPRGVTDVPARYLPAGDWIAGTYAFSVTLESVAANSGQSTVIATAAAPELVVGS
jgi:hypothetical protein